MIAWSIETAQVSGCFDRIIVSTDDDEIAAVAREWGAEVPFKRPAELADDYTGTVDVIAHAIDMVLAEGGDIDNVCCVYPTAPFMSADDLCKALAHLEGGDWSYCFPVTEFAAPIFRSFTIEDDNSVSMFYPEQFSTRSQDLPAAYHDAGQFYWGRPVAWRNHEPMMGPRSSPLVIPRWRVQDIDTHEDWNYAEILWRCLQQQGKGKAS
jgi:N-acylneuraminate cytidylyltransferase